MSNEERNKRIAIEYNEAFKTWDLNNYGKYLTENPTFHIRHRTLAGREGFDEAVRKAPILYPKGIQTDIVSAVAEGNEVILRIEARAENYLGGDETYENQYALALVFTEDGLISEQHEYLDTAYADAVASRAGYAQGGHQAEKA